MKLDRQRSQRIARKLDREKVQDLAARGLSTADIAKHQGVATTSVWRFLRQLKPQQQQLDQFLNRRADCLAQIHGQALDVQERVLERMREDLEDEGKASALSPTVKAKFLQAAVVAGGVSYDKERLERGQSTTNSQLISLICTADEAAWPKQPQRNAAESEQK